MATSGAELFSRLSALREQMADRPAEERRKALHDALAEAVGSLPPADLDRVVGEARRAVASRAPSGGASTSGKDVAELQAEVLALRAKLARFDRDLKTLTDENRRLRDQADKKGAASGPGLDVVRDVLRRAAKGDPVKVESLDLPPETAPLVGLCAQLIHFAVDLENTRTRIIKELEMGPGAMGSTQWETQVRLLLRKRLHEVLDGKIESLPALVESLQAHERFILGMYEGFQAAFNTGARDLVKEFDPDPLLEPHRGRFATSYDEAWKDLTRRFEDLANLDTARAYDQFFKNPFLERFRQWVEMG